MDLHAELTFATDTATAIAMLTDPAYVRRRCERTGGSDVTVDVRPDGAGFVVTSERTLPTDRFPAIAQRFVGSGLRIRQVDTWRPAGAAEWSGGTTVTTGRAPARLEATTRLVAAGAQCREQIDGEVKAPVPFIGGKLEELMHEQVLRGLHMEEQVAAEWLTGAR